MTTRLSLVGRRPRRASTTVNGDGGRDGLSAPDLTSTTNALNGGADDDVLTGQDGADTLDGGLGGDDMAGGAGIDTVTCAGRAEALSVTPDTAADDGAAGRAITRGRRRVMWRTWSAATARTRSPATVSAQYSGWCQEPQGSVY